MTLKQLLVAILFILHIAACIYVIWFMKQIASGEFRRTESNEFWICAFWFLSAVEVFVLALKFIFKGINYANKHNLWNKKLW